MAGLGLNMSSWPTNDFTKRPTQIACRICGLVCTSVPTLIIHAESHMLESDIIINRQLGLMPCLRNRGNVAASPSLERSRVMQARNPFAAFPINPRNITLVPPQAASQLQLSPSICGSFTFGRQARQPPAVTPRRVAEGAPGDGTEPFLQVLDKPYSCKADFSNNSDADMLDLTLRL